MTLVLLALVPLVGVGAVWQLWCGTAAANEERRSYQTETDFIDRLDGWLGPNAPFWLFVDERLIPVMSAMSVGMAGLLFIAALRHGDLVFASLIAGLAWLVRRVRADGVPA